MYTILLLYYEYFQVYQLYINQICLFFKMIFNICFCFTEIIFIYWNDTFIIGRTFYILEYSTYILMFLVFLYYYLYIKSNYIILNLHCYSIYISWLIPNLGVVQLVQTLRQASLYHKSKIKLVESGIMVGISGMSFIYVLVRVTYQII